jgi:RNA polymerase sigma-70 factor (ECF subfamily)
MTGIEPEIIDQCKEGKHMAQMRLYGTFYKRVYNACYRVLYNSLEAEDAMQESFLKAFANIEGYNDSVPFEAWLVRIAINTSIDKLRRKDVDLISLNENIYSEIPDDNDDEDWEKITDKVNQVKAAIEKLPDSSRLIINLYLIEGYDHEEIAGILNIAPGTVRIQYMRAKQKLLQLI